VLTARLVEVTTFLPHDTPILVATEILELEALITANILEIEVLKERLAVLIALIYAATLDTVTEIAKVELVALPNAVTLKMVALTARLVAVAIDLPNTLTTLTAIAKAVAVALV